LHNTNDGVQDLLCVVCRRVREHGCGDNRGDNGPNWLPVTFNLKTELAKFVRHVRHTKIKNFIPYLGSIFRKRWRGGGSAIFLELKDMNKGREKGKDAKEKVRKRKVKGKWKVKR
jgi:hypothetical protein